VSHNNRIANLLTGASLAALSLVCGRSALGATLNGTGTTVIAVDTDFVNIIGGADYDLVVNEAVISDGFDNPAVGGTSAIAVFVSTAATVDQFVNKNVIQAIEGTSAANNATTANAVAQGMRVEGRVPRITNLGLIEAIAVAHDTNTSAEADAQATGVYNFLADSSPGASVTMKLDNHEDIKAYARASAFGLTTANAEVFANGTRLSAVANGANGTARIAVENDGHVAVKSRGLAVATQGDASASATGDGLDPSAAASGTSGVATVKVDNDGHIALHAEASAFALNEARAVAGGTGVEMDANANGGGGFAANWLNNHGDIASKAHALADSTSGNASARVFVTGADEDVEADGGNGVATATLDNDGDISAYGKAEAFAKLSALANLSATGAEQSVSALDGNGVAKASLANEGRIAAKGYALADSTEGDAGVSMLARGVNQSALAQGGGGTAKIWLDNSGDVEAYAKGKASAAGGNAAVSVKAIGADQSATANDNPNNGGDKHAELWLDNSGDVEAYAKAEGFAKSSADVSALAAGVHQTAIADFGPGFGTAKIGLDNHGAIKAKAHILAESLSNDAEATAAASGVFQRAEIRGIGAAAISLDNDAYIGASVEASAFGKTATANVFATGVDQQALASASSSSQSGNRATVRLANDGTIGAYGKAAGFGKIDASVDANATGVNQSANVNRTTGRNGVASATLYNDGDITAKAHGLADSTSGTADGGGHALGVDQGASADSGGGTAKTRLDNDGKIAAHAEGSALGLAASASVVATGVIQFPRANGGSGFANASLDNAGDIDAYAAGKAVAKNTAFLSVEAIGAGQDARAFDGGGIATMRLHNEGRIAAKANGLADAASGSAVAGVQATGVGQIARVGDSGGQAEASLDNDGDIEARVGAKALAKTKADVNVDSTGLLQRAFADGGGMAKVEADNSGTIKAFANAAADGATATAAARARGIVVQGSAEGGTFDVDIHNSGVVVAAAKAAANGAAASASALATGIFVTGTGDGSTKITNDSGTIWAGWSTGGAYNRGNAINVGGLGGFDPAPNAALIALKGNDGPGHLYGDIMLSDDDRIEVTQGKTYFDGVVLGDSDADGNSLDIFDGGNLVLCQEGWTGACDPGGWAGAGPEGNGYDPQTGVNGPSYVFIDTFTVQQDGMLTYQLTSNSAGGTYSQVTAGTANLDGTLRAVYLPAFYADQTTYNNVIAADTRNGTFANVTDNSIFLETTAIYDGNTVDLMATRNAFDEVVVKPSKNQGAVSSAIENVYPKLPGPGVDPSTQGPFAQLVANLFTIDTVGNYQLVLDQLSGAQYAQYLQSVLWSLRALDQSITDRMDCSLNVTGAPVVTGDKFLGAAAGPDGCFTPHQVQTWVRAWGGWNDNDGNLEAPGYSEDQFGIWAGADYAINSRWFIGGAAGYFDSEMDFNKWGGVSGGTIDYDGGQIALYGGYDNAVWYNRAIVKFGWYDGTSHRNFGLTTVVDPSGSPDADVVDFYNEVGRRFAVGASSMLTPYFGITVAHAELDGFTEKDPYGTGAALKVAGSDADSVATALGLRYNGTFGAFKPQVAVAWEHEFEDTFQTVTMSFADAPAGSNFKAIGTDLDEDSILVEAGGAYALNDSSDFSVRYFGRWLSDYDAQSVMGRYTYKFGAAPAPALAPEPLKLGNN